MLLFILILPKQCNVTCYSQLEPIASIVSLPLIAVKKDEELSTFLCADLIKKFKRLPRDPRGQFLLRRSGWHLVLEPSSVRNPGIPHWQPWDGFKMIQALGSKTLKHTDSRINHDKHWQALIDALYARYARYARYALYMAIRCNKHFDKALSHNTVWETPGTFGQDSKHLKMASIKLFLFMACSLLLQNSSFTNSSRTYLD